MPPFFGKHQAIGAEDIGVRHAFCERARGKRAVIAAIMPVLKRTGRRLDYKYCRETRPRAQWFAVGKCLIGSFSLCGSRFLRYSD